MSGLLPTMAEGAYTLRQEKSIGCPLGLLLLKFGEFELLTFEQCAIPHVPWNG